MSRKKRRRLQKAINHTNKQTMRLKQLGFEYLVTDSQDIKQSLLTLASIKGIQVRKGGMPR